MGTETIRRRVIVRGAVQGVGFRYTARTVANRLGATGFVRNREDGGVEIEAEGPPEIVQAVIDWASEGPNSAGVGRIEVYDLKTLGDQRFEIRY